MEERVIFELKQNEQGHIEANFKVKKWEISFWLLLLEDQVEALRKAYLDRMKETTIESFRQG